MTFLAIKMGKYWKVSIAVGLNPFSWPFWVKGMVSRCASHYLKIVMVIIYFYENIYDYNILKYKYLNI